jgi:hypothetical protein
MPVEEALDTGEGPARRCDGKLLAGDLEQQCPVQIHRRQSRNPRAGIEVWPLVDEPRQHRVSVAKVRACAVGILSHVARSLRPAPDIDQGN